VIRGDRPSTKLLESEWSKVAIQTEWKLEPAFRFDDNTDDFANGGSGSSELQANASVPSVSNSSPSVPVPPFNGTVPPN